MHRLVWNITKILWFCLNDNRPKIWLARWHSDLEHFTGHVQFRECFLQTLRLQDHLKCINMMWYIHVLLQSNIDMLTYFICNICAAELKVNWLFWLLSVNLANSHHSSLLKKQSQRVTISYIAHPQGCWYSCNIAELLSEEWLHLLSDNCIYFYVTSSIPNCLPGTVLPPKILRQSSKTVRLTWKPTKSSLIVNSWKISACGADEVYLCYGAATLDTVLLESFANIPGWRHWPAYIWSPPQWISDHLE